MSSEEPESVPVLVVAFGGNVFGMHPRTGERLWRTDIGGGTTPRLLIDGGRVYAFGSALVCLDYASGRQRWRTEVDRQFGSGTMLLHDGIVFLADLGEVIAFDAKTGTQLWHDRFKGEGIGDVSLAVPGVAAQADRSN